MRFDCTIAMNNAAFADISDVSIVEDEDGFVPAAQLAAGAELARILRSAADAVESGERFPTHDARPLLDVNGNTSSTRPTSRGTPSS